ncbi:hypothetical protein MUY27_11200 [Mucilaginibacter sp. RS28]|uniref:Uncharacterized protein n=1 Tax=Mucilaginibacter straminoryzae TaxID=2932774 RepID=A0A9X1X4K5_9SPHI|nr:hypothetical protein [Mucilaginibacter straminoryzae]MCJ8210275.1 hypothetical protein [Mucilaginibacter straminoryzae]
MDATINLQHTDLLSDERYQLKKYSYQLIDGDQSTNKVTELYIRPDAVAVLPYDEERQTFLLTRQFRLVACLNGTSSGYVIEACAGLIDDNQQPE